MLGFTSFVVAAAWRLVPESIGSECAAGFGSGPVAVEMYRMGLHLRLLHSFACSNLDYHLMLHREHLPQDPRPGWLGSVRHCYWQRLQQQRGHYWQVGFEQKPDQPKESGLAVELLGVDCYLPLAIGLEELLEFAAFASIKESITFRCFAALHFGSVGPQVCSSPFVRLDFIELNFARTGVVELAAVAAVAEVDAVGAKAGFADSRSLTIASFDCPVLEPSCWLGQTSRESRVAIAWIEPTKELGCCLQQSSGFVAAQLVAGGIDCFNQDFQHSKHFRSIGSQLCSLIVLGLE